MKYIPKTVINQSIRITSIILAAVSPLVCSAAVLEEVIVTAQKHEQSLGDVDISITAFTGNQLSQLGYTNTVDVAAQTPGLNFSQEHPYVTGLSIRGVSQRDFSSHNEPPVATYVDGAYVSTMGAAHAQMFDLERVEVLRGPQGTLFGRNATGGLLHYITRKPMEEFDAYAELTVADYSQVIFQGAIGGAITKNVLGRLSVASNYHDGWVKNRIGDDLFDTGEYSLRGQLLFQISDQTDLLLKAHHTKDSANGAGFTHTPNAYAPDGLGYRVGRDELATYSEFIGSGALFQTCPGCDAFGYREPDTDPRTGSYDQVGDFDRDISGITGTLTVDLGGITLTSITDLFDMEMNVLQDIDASPIKQLDYYVEQDLKQFSQELRLNGKSERLTWITGVYYLNIDNQTAAGLSPFNIAPFVGLHFPGAFVPYNTGFTADTDTESWAIFGHLEYALTDQWSITTALRYTEDDKEADYVLSDDIPTPDLYFNRNTAPNAVLGFENVSAKVSVNWKPDDNTLVYLSYDRGHKAGSFNYPFIPPNDLSPAGVASFFSTLSYDQEELSSYELGYKSSFLDGRVRLNADLFYYDYKDYQASFFVDLVNFVGNLDAEVVGGELELFMSPTDRLELVLGVSWLDTEVKDVGMPDGSIQDRQLAMSPDFSLNGLARYTWPLMNGNLAVQVDFNYSDEFCFSVVCNYSEQEDSYVVTNARVSYTSGDDKWSVAAFVRNLADTEYRAYTVDSAFVGVMTNTPSPPRWYGGTVTYHWR